MKTIMVMVPMQAEDNFEEEEEYDFWADYSDYNDEQGNTNRVSPLPLLFVLSGF